MKEAKDCKQLLRTSRGEALASEDFAKKTVRAASGSSVSEAALYKKDVLAALRIQMLMSLSQDVFSAHRMFPNTWSIL